MSKLEIYEMSLQDVLTVKDSKTRNLLLDRYYSNLLSYMNPLIKREGVLTDYIEIIEAIKNGSIKYNEVSGYTDTLMSLSIEVAEEENRHRSEYSFAGDVIVLYPSIKTVKSRKIHLCAFSGARIPVGSEYSVYRLFVDNITSNERYCLEEPICMEVGYEDKVPTTVSELDDFDFKLSHAYDLDLEEHYNISVNYGHSGMPFRRLLKTKKR